ncbi:hypothetical protein ASD80_17870 [Devosia sp. Root635]|nr:hypothetical protein ASD80_17870 [Devosia sp. Root635]
MQSYLVLLRGINVGGRNKIAMGKLKALLEELGFAGVAPYLQSGNVIVQSDLAAASIAPRIEQAITAAFKLDSDLIKVLVLSRAQLRAVFAERPKGFGDAPDTYHSDAIFLMGMGIEEAMTAFSPKAGVDTIWPGNGVIYSQRLSALRTKTRLNRMMVSPLYLSMTIRSWGTVGKLLEMMGDGAA